MAKKALKIIKGSTLSETFRYESPKKIYKTISNISNSAPMIITSVGHSLPLNWRVKVTNVVGMVEINDTENYLEGTAISPNTIEINSVNAVGFKAYISGGVLEYNQPINLTGVSAALQVRESIDSESVLLELTSFNGGIVIDPTNSTITIYMSAAASSILSWDKGVYSLELTFMDGTVLPLLEGNVTVLKEITRAGAI
jgi:hypothetical protein